MAGATVGESTPGVVGRTRFAVAAALGRTDGRLVFGGVGVGYLLVYLYAIRDLLPGGSGRGLLVVRDPLSLLFRRTTTFSFEAVALLDVGVVTYEFSPVNLLVGLALAALVATNLAVSYLVWRQPAACGISPGSAAGTGLLGAVPALVSGSACCGPVVLLVVGIQASTAFITLFNVLLPVAAVALVASLLYVGRQVDPELV